MEDRDAEAAIDAMQGYHAQVVTLTLGDQASGEIAAWLAADVSGPADAATPTGAATGDAPAAGTASS